MTRANPCGMTDVQPTPASEPADEIDAGRDTGEDLRTVTDARGGDGGLDTEELPGMNPDEQPGIPDEPMSPAEGGD
jgi:hypothetical protein